MKTRLIDIASNMMLRTICVLMCFATPAFASSSEFIEQCEQLMPEADSFQSKCLAEAVSFGRSFHPSGIGVGERESFRVFLSNNHSNSHFILGCVISGNPMIPHVNLYYKTSPDPLPSIDESQVRYVDFDGNIGLDINGKRIILLSIRQVVTKNIKERLPGLAKNCENSDLNNDKISEISPSVNVYDKNEFKIQFCYSGKQDCDTRLYDNFFNSELGKITFMPQYRMFISDNGRLIVDRQYRQNACNNWKENYDPTSIVLETCAEPVENPKP